MCLFFGIINIVVNNAYIIYQHRSENTKVTRRQFAIDLALELARGWALHRFEQKRYLPREVSSLICTVFEIQDVSREDGPPTVKLEKRQRCHICPSSANTRSRIVCATCRKVTCTQHMTYTCKQCSDA